MTESGITFTVDATQRVEEIYDDADFYEQVLKEFLESAGAPPGVGGGGADAGQRPEGGCRRAGEGG